MHYFDIDYYLGNPLAVTSYIIIGVLSIFTFCMLIINFIEFVYNPRIMRLTLAVIIMHICFFVYHKYRILPNINKE